MRHCAAPQPIYVHVGTQTAAPVIEYVASAFANNFVASALVIEYVAPVSVNTLLEPPVPVVHVMQVRQAQANQEHFVLGETTENGVEFHPVQEQVMVQEIPQIQVIERIQDRSLTFLLLRLWKR